MKAKNPVILLLLAALAILVLFISRGWLPGLESYPRIQKEPSCSEQTCRYYVRTKWESFWKIYVPDWFGGMVASHISEMKKRGYFERISEKDFDHGHLLLTKGSGRNFGSPEEFLRNVKAVLYHTAEFTGLWEKEKKEGKPAELRTPRSILGLADGHIDADLKKFSKYPADFEGSGTIYPVEVCPDLGLMTDDEPFRSRIGGKECSLSMALEIELNGNGRYRAGNQRYDIYIRCLD
jgi:hypothetical protein